MKISHESTDSALILYNRIEYYQSTSTYTSTFSDIISRLCKKMIQLFVEFESTKCLFSYYNGLCLAYKKLRFTIWHKSWPIWYFYWIVVRYNEAQNSKWFWLTLHHLSFCVRWVRCDTNHKRIVVGFYNIIFKWQLKHIIKI